MCEVVQVFCETPYPLNIVMRNEALKCYSFAEKNNNILDDSVDEFPPLPPHSTGYWVRPGVEGQGWREGSGGSLGWEGGMERASTETLWEGNSLSRYNYGTLSNTLVLLAVITFIGAVAGVLPVQALSAIRRASSK